MKLFRLSAVLFTIQSLLEANSCFAQWGDNVLLKPLQQNTYFNYNWSIAANGNVLHVVWYDLVGTNNDELFYKRSTNGGLTWEPDMQLTNNPARSWNPAIAVNGSVVHVFWLDTRDNYEIYYKRSTDNGVSWGNDTRLTNNPAYSDFPAVALSGQNIHLAWYDFRDGGITGEIYYKNSTDGGLTWGNDQRLTNNPAYSRCPSIAVTGQTIHIVWEDERNTDRRVFYKRSTDNGLSWEEDVQITNQNSVGPSIATSGSNVHITWHDFRNGVTPEIYYIHSTDAGLSWLADKRITYHNQGAYYPSIAAFGSNIHLVWYDYRHANWEIYYSLSTDNGSTWETDTRLTDNTYFDQYPSVVVSGNAVHVVWYQLDNASFSLFYKRNPTGNPTSITYPSTVNAPVLSLEQNFPNPFNINTMISFKLTDARLVSLKVYDFTGKEVAVVFNDYLQPGIYETTFNAWKLNSGIYIYRLEAGDFIETKKMTIAK